jgi:hypothetical protein
MRQWCDSYCEGVSLLNASKLILVKKANSIKIPINIIFSFYYFIYLLSIKAAAVAVPLSTSVKPLSL